MFKVTAQQIKAILQARLKRAAKVAEFKRANGEPSFREDQEIRQMNWLLEFTPQDVELEWHDALTLIGDAREP